MTVSFPFQSQHTWAKLGYLYFTDSLSYREVLDQNPQWTVTQLPPLGAQIKLDNTNSVETVGGTVQGSTIYGYEIATDPDEIFPFETQSSYTDALNRYTLQGVVNRESINGINFDSAQAITGLQKGVKPVE